MNIISRFDLPVGVEVRHLVALEAVAQTGSFSQAATRLGYAQSAISQQISTLERAVGHRLVVRPGGPRPVSLTEAGKVLLEHAGHIIARLAAAKADLDAMAAGDAGILRVGTFQSASARLLPPTLARFRTAWPDINVELHNEPVGVQLEGLIRTGQADLAFADIASFDESHAMVELIRDPSVLITTPDHPLAQADTVDLAELAGVRMISMPIDDAFAIRTARALERVGVEPDIVFRSDENLTTQRLVAIGLGVAIVPLLTVERSIPDAQVAIRALNANLERQIGIIWHRDRLQSRAAEAFIETAVQISLDVDMPTVPSLSSPG
ncbi:MAG: LysR family transcriptional regulator [Actinomycetota bacterium]|nr:LysR family transcriptional regulator [Actinomycetota bacterium]